MPITNLHDLTIRLCLIITTYYTWLMLELLCYFFIRWLLIQNFVLFETTIIVYICYIIIMSIIMSIMSIMSIITVNMNVIIVFLAIFMITGMAIIIMYNITGKTHIKIINIATIYFLLYFRLQILLHDTP